jgi:2-iminobutanoate/2-iminopropanoate deaminase
MEKQVIQPEDVYKPAAPYAPVIKVKGAGNLVFMAGIAPSDIDGRIICPGDIMGQTRQAVKNVLATLKAAGGLPGDIVMTTTYVVESSMKDFLESGAAGECLVSLSNPTDTLVGVATLAGTRDGQLIEITAIAVTK